MAERRLRGISDDAHLAREIEGRLAGRAFHPVAAIVVRPGDTTPIPTSAMGQRQRRARAAGPRLGTGVDRGEEAIILRYGRPSLLIRNGTFEVPTTDTWRVRLYPSKRKLDAAIRSVGRVEVNDLSTPYLGTAWIIADGIAITNRHVAADFARRQAQGYEFRTSPTGRALIADVDFHEEVASATPFESDVVEILYLAEDTDSAPDVALLRVKPRDRRPLPPPIPLFDGNPTEQQLVAAIGYPAQDTRDPVSDQVRIFGNKFEVKRLAPGRVTEILNAGVFSHDCTTLGGSSGSAVIDVSTGTVLGLHYAGIYREANYAVSATTLKSILGRLRNVPHVRTVEPPAAPRERVVTPADFTGRRGFDPAFLGPDRSVRVGLPQLSPKIRKATFVTAPGSRGTKRYLLNYEHFSLAMHAERGMAVFTAVNLDGSQEVRLKRLADPWAKDPRIPAGVQIGGDLYAGNELDQGHLVRRLDPMWGPTARLAERDTFFYTNCTPQYSSFNRALWAELEDYLLDNAQTDGFRACVFTGPVLADDDPVFKEVALPRAYWKVAAMLRADSHELSATAYVVSQADLISNLEFVYGQCKTYQVPIAKVETLTGLNFGGLDEVDAFRDEEGVGFREISSPTDVVVI